MKLPFNSIEFLEVFRHYHLGIWPALLPLLFAGMIGILAIWEAWPQRDRIAGAVLAGLWLWAGAVYHLGYFTRLTSAASGFAALFVAQAVMLGYYGASGRLAFQRPPRARRVLGAFILGYALVGYPVVAIWSGQAWPRIPTFGAPCPITIYTFGLLLWAADSLPRRLLIVPVLWTIIGTSAALQLGIWEDWGLPIAAVVAIVALRPWHVQEESDFRSPGGTTNSHPA